MSRGALLTGTAGGIIGTIDSAIGIIWCVAFFIMPRNYLWFYTGPSTFTIVISILFMALLLVALILTGIGFYGLYTIGGHSMGVVALIFGIIGGAAFLILGLVDLFAGSYVLTAVGLLILLVSFIIIGVASIVMREVTMNPSAALAAGILSIIGGIFAGAIIGFGLLFVAFLLWAIVFYNTEA
ncbi:MAG: hypothetical protein QW279_10605 [Candidatus Jordarchaeaceae archaeon]